MPKNRLEREEILNRTMKLKKELYGPLIREEIQKVVLDFFQLSLENIYVPQDG